MEEFTPYEHRVAYYETDQMGVVHHSNYIRWFEEARDDFVRRNGIDYRLVEAEGVLLPVKSVSCDYRSAAGYGDLVEIAVRPVYFNGVRLRCEYEVRRKEDGALIVTGRSEHCYIDAATRRPLNLRKRMPEYCRVLSRLVEGSDSGRE